MREWISLIEGELSKNGVPDAKKVETLRAELAVYSPVTRRANALFDEALSTMELSDDDSQRRIHAGLEGRFKDLARKIETYSIINDGEEKEEIEDEGVEKALGELDSKLDTIKSCLNEPMKVATEEDALKQLQKLSAMKNELAKMTDKCNRLLEPRRSVAEVAAPVGRLLEGCSEAAAMADGKEELLLGALGDLAAGRMLIRAAEADLSSLEDDTEAAKERMKQGPESVKLAEALLPVRKSQ